MRVPWHSMLCVLAALLPFNASPAGGADSRDADAQSEYRAVIHAHVDRAHGERLFQSTCARCHGSAGGGADDGGIPALAGQRFRVLARQLVDYRHDERWDVRMEHFADFPYLVFAQDVADVAGYLAQLPRSTPRTQGNGEYLAHGRVLYARRCARCHGATGMGEAGRAYPRLAGQHYPYLVRQMHDALEGRRPNFSRDHVRLLSSFDRDDIDGVADYLSRLPSGG